MLVVKVELHSARTHEISEIARMVIYNKGGSREKGDYNAFTVKDDGPDKFADNMSRVDKHVRKGEVLDHPRLSAHVWSLVAKALKACDY